MNVGLCNVIYYIVLYLYDENLSLVFSCFYNNTSHVVRSFEDVKVLIKYYFQKKIWFGFQVSIACNYLRTTYISTNNSTTFLKFLILSDIHNQRISTLFSIL